jgi:hypothetical protein
MRRQSALTSRKVARDAQAHDRLNVWLVRRSLDPAGNLSFNRLANSALDENYFNPRNAPGNSRVRFDRVTSATGRSAREIHGDGTVATHVA